MRAESAKEREDTIMVVAATALVAFAGVAGLFACELLLAWLIDGHSPVWALIARICYASGVIAALTWSGLILIRGSRRGL
jgi:hypothetical protein